MFYDDLTSSSIRLNKWFCIGTRYKFVVFPRRSCINDEFIFLKKAYCRTNMYTGPGEPIYENLWLTKEQYIIAKLKGDI